MAAPAGAHQGDALTERSFTQGAWPMAIHDTELRLLVSELFTHAILHGQGPPSSCG